MITIRNRLKTACQSPEERLWLSHLPEQIKEARERWALEIHAPFFPGGYNSWTAPCTMKNGQPAVLKLTPSGLMNDAVALMRENQGLFLPIVIDYAGDALLMELLEGQPLFGQSDAAQEDLLPLLLDGIESLQVDHGLDLKVIPEVAHQELMNSTDAFLINSHTFLRSVAKADCRYHLLHGDLHEEQIFISGRVRAIDPEPVLGPLGWEIEPLFRRYLDRGDLEGAARLSARGEKYDLPEEESIYYGLLRAQYIYSKVYPGDSARKHTWKNRILGFTRLLIDKKAG